MLARQPSRLPMPSVIAATTGRFGGSERRRNQPCVPISLRSVCGWGGSEERIRTVSYTHLDVYKRQIQTGIGPVEVRRAKVRDRGDVGAEEKIRFTSSILPKWARRTKSQMCIRDRCCTVALRT